MVTKLKMLALVSGLAIAAGAATPAWAEGTKAGTTITNTVTVNYKVENIAQDAKEASDTFTVDRKINMTVAEEGTETTTVTPGQQQAVTTFIVTNSSNDIVDFGLDVSQLSGGTAKHGGTDTVTLTNVKIYLDANDSGAFDDGDTEADYLDEVAEDDTIRVFVIGNVPSGLATGAVAGVKLSATAREGGTATTKGAVVTETTGANTAGVDTVFADDAISGGDELRNGVTFGEDDYTVLTAALSALKTSRVISDPFNGTSDPKMIPGAVVEYCVAVTNGGGATATNVSVSDALPATTTYSSAFGIKINGTVADGECLDDGVDGGSLSEGVVSADLDDLSSAETRTLKFQVTVN
jgi:uncharacterized repeat protein (TIGR01451 family)